MKTAMQCLSAPRAQRQSLEEGCLPIVRTDWSHGDIAIRQRATAVPLRGTAYETGLESTLAWAAFDITNRGKEPREVAFFAAQSGDDTNPKRKLSLRDGVVMDGDIARWSARVPAGFSLEFPQPCAGNNKLEGKVDRPSANILLREGGLYNVFVVRGLSSRPTARVVVNRVLDFPGTLYWSGKPPKVAAEELYGAIAGACLRSRPHDLEEAGCASFAADDARRRCSTTLRPRPCSTAISSPSDGTAATSSSIPSVIAANGTIRARNGSTPWT